IAEAAEGNPLFVEQLAAMANEYGAEAAMPGSIRGVLHERHDRLGREDRTVLKRAAVAGRSCSLEAVLELTPPGDHEATQSLLRTAAQEAFGRTDLPATISLYERARALLPGGDAAQPALLTELAYARIKAGDVAGAETDLDRALAAARLVGDRAAELHALVER